MSEFKEMKFLVDGDKELAAKVVDILSSIGYDISDCDLEKDGVIKTYGNGCAATLGKEGPLYYSGEEINIDWMRTQKPETIELNGKTYIKSELEEALRKIKPVSK